VTVREAIEQSLNVPFARIGLTVGPERIVATARRLGITSPLHPVPSLALGSSEVTLLELVRAYGVFAAGGSLSPATALLGPARLGDDPPLREPPEASRVVDPAEAYLVTSALEGVIARGTGRALAGVGRFGDLAGKTGTSNDGRDAWFVAYSPALVVGAWVGFDDGRAAGLTGAGAALPIVARFLDQAAPTDGWSSFPVPDGIEVAQVGGSEQGWFDSCGSREVFLEGTAPESECGGFRFPEWDRPDLERWRVRVESRSGRVMAELLERLLERAREER
jgi:membrane carboxypeptidase/penicillin-binding protein